MSDTAKPAGPAPSATPSTAAPKPSFHQRLMQAMVGNLNRASTASHEAKKAKKCKKGNA